MNLPANFTYVGVDDHDIDLFEGQFVVPNGISYNSFIIQDEKIAVMDSVDKHFTDQWLTNIKEVLGQKTPDYLVVSHMEPDHSGSIQAFMEAFPNTTIVLNAKSAPMLEKYFGANYSEQTLIVKNEDTLSLGEHTLTFIFAPMVHWPEVMMSYEPTTKTLFSADAFGKFGVLSHNEEWACEARRYYFGIVAPYGKQVQNTLKKLGSFEIERICPLHGPILDHDLETYLSLYNTWSSYEAETKGVAIAYASVYGHTKVAAEKLAELLSAKGTSVELHDLTRGDEAEAIEDAFRYTTLVCASVTYNGSMFPAMRNFLADLVEKKYQNRTVAFIQNGSWAPAATKAMKSTLEGCKNITFCEQEVSVAGALTPETEKELELLANALA